MELPVLIDSITIDYSTEEHKNTSGKESGGFPRPLERKAVLCCVPWKGAFIMREEVDYDVIERMAFPSEEEKEERLKELIHDCTHYPEVSAADFRDLEIAFWQLKKQICDIQECISG